MVQRPVVGSRGFLALALMTGLALAACSDGKDESAAPEMKAPAAAEGAKETATASAGGISDAVRAEAKQIFEQRCVTCHGTLGKGDGPASKGLTPSPRDFTDSGWQASVTDDHIEKIIKYGGAAVGKSPMMPANPDLNAKDDVVRAMREYIRSLEGK